MQRRSILPLGLIVLSVLAARSVSDAAVATSEIDIGGRVLGPKGIPLAEAEVLLLPSLDPVQTLKLSDSGAPAKPTARVLTDAQGGFHLTAPRAGLWRVRVQSSGFVPAEYALEPLLEPVDLPDAEMTSDFGLTVKVTGRDGLPIPKARIRLASPEAVGGRFQSSAWKPPTRLALTDANGAAVLLRSEKEPSVLTVSAPGYALQERRNVRGTAAIFKLQPGADKTIAVVGADKTPVAGVLVQASDSSHPFGFTDAQGRLKVTVPAAGTLPILVVAEDGRRAQGTVSDQPTDIKGGMNTKSEQGKTGDSAKSPDSANGSGAEGTRGSSGSAAAGTTGSAASDSQSGSPGSSGPSGTDASRDPSIRVFRLPERLAVKGRLIDARTRSAIAGGLVWSGDEVWAAASSDSSGAYTLRGPSGRNLDLHAGAVGYLKANSSIGFIGDGRSGPTLALKPASVIEGTVVDEGGRPIAGAEANLDIKRSGERIVIMFGRDPGYPRAVTSARGTFRLSPVDPENNYTLKVAAKGFASTTKEILGLEPQKTMSGVRIEMSQGQSVSGRVVDGEGHPLREVDASIRPAARAGRPGPVGAIQMGGGSPAPALKATTDNEGRFRIAGLASGTFDLELRRSGFASKTVPAVEVKKDPGPVDLGEVVMEPGLRVQGLVSAPDGTPIEGVEVSVASAQPGPMMMMRRPVGPAQPPAAVTGPDGRFAVEDLRADEPVGLTFNRSGYVQGRENGLTLPRVEPLQVTLQPASKIIGQVVGPDKKPIAGAEVSLTRSQSGGIGNEMFKMIVRDSATAGDDGRFVFDNVSPGTISLSAEAPSWREAKIDGIDVPQGKDVEGIEILLKPGATVSGRVLSPDGRPVIGARVGLVTDEPEPMGLGGTTSDGDGAYRLEGLTPGRFSLEATSEDYVRATKEIEARAGANKLDLQFEGGQQVSGSVTDTSGTPLGGAWVQLAAAGRDWGGPETTTKPDGTFKVEGVGDGDYKINASREGFASTFGAQDVHVEGKPVAGLRVQLGVGGRITGTISGVDPAKLTQVDVRAFGEGPGASSAVDRRGTYKLENLQPGNWTVTASIAATGQQARGKVVLEAGTSEASLDLQFGQGLTLSGRALQGESAIVGAVLFAQGTNVNHSAWGRTGAEGSFRMEGLEPGTYRVELRQWETGLSYDETFEITSSREVTLKIPTARIVGRIVDGSDRKAISGVTVSLARSGQEGRGSAVQQRGATSDLNGRFEIANITDGTWIVTASKTGYAASTAEVSVQGHDVDDVSVVLDATEGLALEARLPSGRIPDTVDVAVVDPSGRSLLMGSYATGENGRVRLSSVPPGSWELVVSAAGSGVLSLRVAVPGPTVSAALPPACNLRVTVPALAGTNTAATATIKGDDGHVFRTLGWMSDALSQWRLSSGHLELDTLPPGSWTVQVAASDGRTWSGTSSTKPGAPAEVTLQ